MFKVVVAHSEDVDPLHIAEDLIEQCQRQLSGRPVKVALLLSTNHCEHQPLIDAINNAWRGIALIGGSTDGELSSAIGFADASTALAIFSHDDSVQIVTGLGRNLSSDTKAACAEAVASARAKTSLPLRLCLALPESMTANMAVVISSLTELLGVDVPVFGGTTAGNTAGYPSGVAFKSTQQFFGNEVLSDSLPIMLVAGNVISSSGVAGGWNSIGEVGTVTSSTGLVVQAIDNMPTLSFYKKQLGGVGVSKPEFPLAILDANGGVDYFRAPNSLADNTRGVTFFGDVPMGARVRITVGDRAAILQGCEASIRMAKERFPADGTPECALIFSCICRKLLLGTRTAEEAKLVASHLGDVAFCGFYGYGEFAPSQEGQAAYYHNMTFVTVLLGS